MEYTGCGALIDTGTCAPHRCLITPIPSGQEARRASFYFGPICLLYCVAMLTQVLEEGREAADRALEKLLPLATQHPTSIHQAMRHSVFAGGKRLRPILCMEAGKMVAGSFPAGI